MAKPRKTLRLRIPEYVAPRLRWRKLIAALAQRECAKRGITYHCNEDLELHVRFYLKGNALEFHDLDNRLKDVMDALQGRVGGPKKQKPRSPVIPNDKQVFKVIVEKAAPPKQSHGLGHLLLRPLRMTSRIHLTTEN